MSALRRIGCALLALALFAGCAGKQEISELAIVTGVGLDLTDDGEGVRVTAQIVRAADARGQTGAPAGGTGEPIYSVSAEGDTIFAAIRNLARISSRRVYWAHNFVIAMSEEYAREGISDMVDFFTRNHELRMETWVVVTPDRAEEFISTRTGIEILPGESVEKLFWYSDIVGEAPQTNMMNVEEMLLSDTTHPMIARAALRKAGISNKKPEKGASVNQAELSGAAVFKKDRMVGWLKPGEARAAVFFIQDVESLILPLACPGEEKHKATVELQEHRFNVKPALKNGEISFLVSMDADADLVEFGCDGPLESALPDIEKVLEKELRQGFESMLEVAQNDYQVDFLKLGDRVRNEYPVYWHRIERRWDSIFPDVEIEVDVHAEITSSVLKVRGGRK
ncbi:Ger(x)C family spore germination protein [Paenibacillus antri]|uniref:Ger(X)C family spore germination protein n=1 Tax=Paenibacillus antri TaxID=2582848 RepID=A0A5R9G9C8_9BACL|nr:Ger(x)C family spore germination protein [Paenibacillus antri]TLS50966.1 Ger(x)C family spore germination protein [Paenibacillus antri]